MCWFLQDFTSIETDSPKFPDCLQQTLLVWVPCGWLWVSLPFYTLFFISKPETGTLPHSALNITKTVSTSSWFMSTCRFSPYLKNYQHSQVVVIRNKFCSNIVLNLNWLPMYDTVYRGILVTFNVNCATRSWVWIFVSYWIIIFDWLFRLVGSMAF